ncbi:hypothetical protein PoB_001021000 [Plakobranchus ocellatus]|uniref:Uncharacterized protein n=1 Tax=Plakobranchus ocellatus TaxID=259542 RepID=A0AAV3YKR2_9GAST|nr:hypothetical protein PoB_001021000 [Plakobranchus ocellatus]
MPVAVLAPARVEPLQISGRICEPLCHPHPVETERKSVCVIVCDCLCVCERKADRRTDRRRTDIVRDRGRERERRLMKMRPERMKIRRRKRKERIPDKGDDQETKCMDI